MKHNPKKLGCTCASCAAFLSEMMKSCELLGIDVDIFPNTNLDDTNSCQHSTDKVVCQDGSS